jgi:hypothetical protein
MTAPTPIPPEHRPPAGHAGTRLNTGIIVALVVGIFGAGLGISAWLVEANAGSPRPPICPPGQLCSIPPTPPEPPACPRGGCATGAEETTTSSTVQPATRCSGANCDAAAVPDEPRTGDGIWRSRDLGFSFETEGYPPSDENGNSVTFQFDGTNGKFHSEARVEGVAASEATPDELLSRRRDAMSETILGLTEDTAASTMLDGPSIGFVSGVGGSYRGTLLSGSLDPDKPAVVAIFAATNGRITVVFSYTVTGYRNAADVLDMRGWEDGVLSSFEWAS